MVVAEAILGLFYATIQDFNEQSDLHFGR